MEVVADALAKKWPLRKVCAGCGSGLRIELSDLSFSSWKVSGYHFCGTAECEWKYTFACPVCGVEANGNEVPEDTVPLDTRTILKTAYNDSLIYPSERRAPL